MSALTSAAGDDVLDVHTDADHNRSVLTLVGEGAPRAVAIEAVRQIDIRAHTGAHPRMGAVDVVPLVPIRGVDMKDCIALAREIGAAIAERHQLPVFLYEEAATAEHRRNLANVRKGEFEGFPDKITDPDWKPDFGPSRVHPTAGCVAIGARAFLIAYNINLATADVEVAKRIGKAIRHSNGGLRFVKAMGVMLEDRGIA
ncbi:MAG: glutamate formimidoyltransferase, partial [Acidimicrobiales bacterium]